MGYAQDDSIIIGGVEWPCGVAWRTYQPGDTVSVSYTVSRLDSGEFVLENSPDYRGVNPLRYRCGFRLIGEKSFLSTSNDRYINLAPKLSTCFDPKGNPDSLGCISTNVERITQNIEIPWWADPGIYRAEIFVERDGSIKAREKNSYCINVKTSNTPQSNYGQRDNVQDIANMQSCQALGGTYQNGLCIFSDGSSCDSTAIQNNQCIPPILRKTMDNAVMQYCRAVSGTYQNGLCIFSDGSSCDSTAIQNNQCIPPKFRNYQQPVVIPNQPQQNNEPPRACPQGICDQPQQPIGNEIL